LEPILTRLKPIRFSIRSLLLLAALIATFLGWRLRNPESQVIAAIKDAGGRVVLGCNFGFIYEGTKRKPARPDVFVNSNPVPPLTLSQVIFGDNSERRVNVVELPIEKITPELADMLTTLRNMQFLIVYLPGQPEIFDNYGKRLIVIQTPDANFKQRLAELRVRFGNRLLCH
jgi:hypothetical protein